MNIAPIGKIVNPTTGRLIDVGGRMHLKLVKQGVIPFERPEVEDQSCVIIEEPEPEPEMECEVIEEMAGSGEEMESVFSESGSDMTEISEDVDTEKLDILSQQQLQLYQNQCAILQNQKLILEKMDQVINMQESDDDFPDFPSIRDDESEDISVRVENKKKLSRREQQIIDAFGM